MFGFGNPLSGITSTVKLVAASTAIIAIVGYLAVQRADTITAATAEKEIEALLEVNRVNQERQRLAEELAAEERQAGEAHQEKRKQAEARLVEQTRLIQALPKQGEGSTCSLDCTLPTLPSQ